MIICVDTGDSNPCFDDVRLRVSADVLLQGTRERSDTGVDRSGWRRMLSLLLSQRSFMATVWKRSNPQYLTARFRDHTARQNRITTKEQT